MSPEAEDVGEGDTGGALLRIRLGAGVDGVANCDVDEICRNRLVGVVLTADLTGVENGSSTRGRVCV